MYIPDTLLARAAAMFSSECVRMYGVRLGQIKFFSHRALTHSALPPPSISNWTFISVRNIKESRMHVCMYVCVCFTVVVTVWGSGSLSLPFKWRCH